MKLTKFIKNIFYDSELDFLNEKDIIWAKRYDTEEEKYKIAVGHRTGPFIIIYKKGRKVYGLECGSNKSYTSKQLLKLKLNNRQGYNIEKDGYIFVGKLVLLSKDRFIQKRGTINDYDLNRIYKSIYLVNKRYKDFEIKPLPKRKLKYYYEKGDIISYKGQMYYISNIDNEYYYMRQTHESKKGKIRIEINDIMYSINFAGEKKIPINRKLKLLNITDDNIISNIEEIGIKEEKRTSKKNVPTTGKLISYDGNLYLIYDIKQNKLFVYKVYIPDNMTENMYEIKIRRGKYYTLFEKEELNVTENIKVHREASIIELNIIKNIKKSIKAQMKEKNKKETFKKQSIMYKEYKPGLIIMDCETLDRFIILKRNDNVIIYSPLDDINNYMKFDFSKTGAFNYQVVERMEKFRFNTLLNGFNKVHEESLDEEKEN